ncbi:MAG TPA: hypothetical protein VG435_18480 [Acidimicrobiales bacterium]|jgi:hypothetical protein|nr:hypothetical protein [Acidimicrobiales bacterium]
MPGTEPGVDSLEFNGMSSVYWVSVVGVSFLAALALTLLILGLLVPGESATVVVGALGLVIAGPLAVAMAAQFSRPVKLTKAALRIPRYLGAVEVPITSIVHTGLVYESFPHSRTPGGWYLHVWLESCESIRVQRFVVTDALLRPPTQTELHSEVSEFQQGLATSHLSAGLRAARPGRIAAAIMSWVSELNPDAVRFTVPPRLQRSDTRDREGVEARAVWFPDGRIVIL